MARHLPDDIVEKILTFLPIIIAARATLFSQKLTRSWRQNRNLHFIQRPDAIPDDNKYIELIDNIMNQHSGSKIDSLVLRLDPAGHEDQIHGWIRMAVAKGVEDLDLDFGEAAFPLSSDLLDSEFSRIRVLKLAGCQVDFSEQQIEGFRGVKTIVFQNLTIRRSLMRSIQRNCLELENLEIRECRFQSRLLRISTGLLDHFKSLKVENSDRRNCRIKIYSQTIEDELAYSGQVCRIRFERPIPRLLNCLSLTFLPSLFLADLPRVRLGGAMQDCTKLQICGKMIQGIFPRSAGDRYRDDWEFPRMVDLTLWLNGTNVARNGTSIITPCDIVYFLQRCPPLEKLFVDLGDYPFGLFWRLGAQEMFERSPPRFQSLRSVIINGFKYRRFEFQLLRMIVRGAPSLRNVTLVKSTVNVDSARERELCLTWMRAQSCTFNLQM